VPKTWQPSPLAQGIINFGNYLQNLPGALGELPGAMASAFYDPTQRFGKPNYPVPSDRLIRSGDANLGADPGAPWGSPSPRRSPDLVPAQQRQSPSPNAGAGPNGPNPNAIVQGQDGIGEEYRQRLNAYNNQATLARQALQGYDPSKGPLPGAAQEARDQGLDIWKGFYAGTKMGQEGGAIGTFNPLMQAHDDVPSMEELWKGIGGGAPTTGPSQDAIKAAMARGINQPGSGGYFTPPGSPNPTAGFDQSANPAAASLQQQIDTAKQAYSGTEATTALQRTHDFLRGVNLGNLNPGTYNFFGNANYSGVFSQPIQTGNYQ